MPSDLRPTTPPVGTCYAPLPWCVCKKCRDRRADARATPRAPSTQRESPGAEGSR